MPSIPIIPSADRKTPMHVIRRFRGQALLQILLLVLLPCALHASALPTLHGRVNDEAHVLGSSADAIEAKLAAHESRTGDQMVVLVVPDLHGQDIESYANDVFAQWKLGHKGVDNGVLMVVSIGDRRARIEVGYGLEGQLTDLASSQILRYRMHPHFAAGDYAGGVEEGVDGVLGVLDGGSEATAPAPKESPQDIVKREGFWRSGVWLFVVFVGLFCLLFGWMAAQGGSWWTYLLLGPLCLPLLLLVWPWPVVAGLFAFDLLLVGWWRWRRMRNDFLHPPASGKHSARSSIKAWPPSPGQMLLWSGPLGSSLASTSRGGGSSGGSSGDSSGSSDYSGGGGSSGGGGASDSW
jgi:uncharacterized protein